jgi:hypothetical protein
MADYSSHKVPDLKKILQERGLVISGNKADLIARLQEDDKKAGSGAGAGKHTPTLSSRCARPCAPLLPRTSGVLLCRGCRIHFRELGNANMSASQQQVAQERMKSTGTKTTNPPPSPQPQPSQQAAKARYLRPSLSRTKKLP